MPTFLSLLRGINVSGQKQMKMQDLQTLYEELHFSNVATYIQSGNVVFENKSATNLAQKIEQKIFERYSFSVPVIIVTEKELQRVVKNNPLLQEKNIDAEKLYVTLCAETPKNEFINKLLEQHFEPEQLVIVGKCVYLYCPNGYGRAKLNNNFLENKLKVTTTTRNWKTMNVLLKMMGNAERR
jgi:uncharacterized protein (DUF1697 family)